MKYLFFLLLFFSTNLKGQDTLTFDHRFVESENKWVVLPSKKDTFSYGFIYIDASAGLTLNYEGSFTMAKDGKFIPKKPTTYGVKYRLTPNNVRVAIIPSSRYHELEITEYPDWLKTYLGDTTSIGHLYRWGFLYNSYDECGKALTYLERGQKVNPKFSGLEVELAFSYNCLKQYDKAISVLNSALETNPTSGYFYKELIYAQINSNQMDEASKNCKKALSICTDKTYNGEMCYNLLHGFYMYKDKKNFGLWVEETKKWNSTNAKLTNDIKIMEADFAK